MRTNHSKRAGSIEGLKSKPTDNEEVFEKKSKPIVYTSSKLDDTSEYLQAKKDMGLLDSTFKNLSYQEGSGEKSPSRKIFKNTQTVKEIVIIANPSSKFLSPKK
jgi:hypothetical protein